MNETMALRDLEIIKALGEATQNDFVIEDK